MKNLSHIFLLTVFVASWTACIKPAPKKVSVTVYEYNTKKRLPNKKVVCYEYIETEKPSLLYSHTERILVPFDSAYTNSKGVALFSAELLNSNKNHCYIVPSDLDHYYSGEFGGNSPELDVNVYPFVCKKVVIKKPQDVSELNIRFTNRDKIYTKSDIFEDNFKFTCGKGDIFHIYCYKDSQFIKYNYFYFNANKGDTSTIYIDL